jgi:hypothetical protein
MVDEPSGKNYPQKNAPVDWVRIRQGNKIRADYISKCIKEQSSALRECKQPKKRRCNSQKRPMRCPCITTGNDVQPSTVTLHCFFLGLSDKGTALGFPHRFPTNVHALVRLRHHFDLAHVNLARDGTHAVQRQETQTNTMHLSLRRASRRASARIAMLSPWFSRYVTTLNALPALSFLFPSSSGTLVSSMLSLHAYTQGTCRVTHKFIALMLPG